MGKVTGFLEHDRKDRSYFPVKNRIKDFKEFLVPLNEKELKNQASRCMDCGIPYCHTGCPVNNIIPDWNDMVYNGEIETALKTLHSTNNFPEFTGRICPAPCEAACTLNIEDNPVTIKTIECSIIDEGWKLGLVKPTYTLCCYPVDDNWAVAQSALLHAQIDTLENEQKYRVLFSAHGLPKKIISQGDPYQWQVERSAEAIARASNLAEGDWAVCYQSRVGPLEWIGPSLDDELRRAAEDEVAVIVLPIAFVSEHSETLVELDVEYKKIAVRLGISTYKRVPALGTHRDFIYGLRDLSIAAFKNKINFGPLGVRRFCPQSTRKCKCA